MSFFYYCLVFFFLLLPSQKAGVARWVQVPNRIPATLCLNSAVTQEDTLVGERAWHMAVIYSYFEADAKVFLRDLIGIPSLPLVSSRKQYARGQTRLWAQL